jgi:hypothetical protein
MLSCWCSGTRTRCCAATSVGCGANRPTGCGSPRWHGSYPAGAGPHLPRAARDAAGLALQTGGEQVRHEQPAQARPTADNPEHRPPCCWAGEGESAVGIPPDPRRAYETRRDHRAIHVWETLNAAGIDPAPRRSGADLAAAPARPGPPGSSPSTSSMWTPCSCPALPAGPGTAAPGRRCVSATIPLLDRAYAGLMEEFSASRGRSPQPRASPTRC